MDLKERFDEVSARMDELKAKAEKASQDVKESWAQGIDDFRADMEFNRANFDEIADDAERKHDLRVEERIDRRIARAEALRDKINDLGEAYAKADQEELILGLLEYADECQAVAVYMAEEAAAAYKAAANEIAAYNDKYGA